MFMRLVYAVYFRGEGETQWKLLRDHVRENSITVDADALADGKYYFRVLASNREANPPAAARTSDLTSAPVMIDNTPPVVTMGAMRRESSRVVVEFEAADAASAPAPLRILGGRSGLDAAGSRGRRDRLAAGEVRAHAGEPGAGRALLVVRAVDSAGNAGLAKLVLK